MEARIRIHLAKILAGASVLAGALAASAPALAQDKPTAQNDTGLGEIIVTARKVEEKLQNVPVTVTAYSGEQLRSQNAVNFADLAKFTPGFATVQAQANKTSLNMLMRGQAQGDILATLEPSVGTYVDGVYVARAYGINADLLDVANVQVLKGPQGTLFGRNTSAGAVLLETKKPNLSAMGAEFSGTYGRFNEVGASVVVNLPVVTDQLAVRGAVQFRQRDGYVTDTGSKAKYENVDNIDGRVKVLWQPTPNLSILGSAEWYRDKSNGPAWQAVYLAGTALTYQNSASLGFPALQALVPALAQAPQPPASQIGLTNSDPGSTWLNDAPSIKVKTRTYNLSATLDESFGTLKLIGGYRKISSRTAIDLDGTPYQILQTNGYEDLHQWSFEGQLTGRAMDGKLSYALGATYFTEAGVDGSTSNNVTGLSPFFVYRGFTALPAGTIIPNTTSLTRGEIDNKSVGVYGQFTYHLTDQLSFTGGLRWSQDKKALDTFNGTAAFNGSAYISCSIAGVGAVVANNCLASHADTFRAVSYTAGLDYQVTPDVLIYVKTSRGYRSGGENLRANGVAATFQPFQPEINNEQEIGLKSEFLDRKVRFNFAGYYNRISNAQRSLLLGVPGSTSTYTYLLNAGKARNLGFEADLAIKLTPDFTFTATGSVNDAKYLDYRQPLAIGSTTLVDHSGDAFSLAPKSSFSVAGNYSHDFGFGTLSARVDYAWLSSFYSSANTLVYSATGVASPNAAAAVDSFTIPATGILGARLGVSFAEDKYNVSVWGKNLTNNRSYANTLYIQSLGFTSGIRRDPVTYGVTVGAKF